MVDEEEEKGFKSKEEIKLLEEIIWKDLKVLDGIHIRYKKLLGEFGLGGGTLGGIFESNYATYKGIILSLEIILSKIIKFA